MSGRRTSIRCVTVSIVIGKSESLRQPRFAHFHNIHASDKPVAVLSNRFYIAGSFRCLAEELAHPMNALFKIVVFDDGVGPDTSDQLIFCNEMTPAADQE